MPRVNSSPLSAREGTVTIDGIEVADSCKFQVVFKPDVWSGKSLGKKGTSRRWIGYDIEVTLEQWKTNRRYMEIVSEYIASGKTPEMTIIGTVEDKNSDYWDVNSKADVITCRGCVPTGDINLMDCDTEGEVVKESITFGAYDVV